MKICEWNLEYIILKCTVSLQRDLYYRASKRKYRLGNDYRREWINQYKQIVYQGNWHFRSPPNWFDTIHEWWIVPKCAGIQSCRIQSCRIQSWNQSRFRSTKFVTEYVWNSLMWPALNTSTIPTCVGHINCDGIVIVHRRIHAHSSGRNQITAWSGVFVLRVMVANNSSYRPSPAERNSSSQSLKYTKRKTEYSFTLRIRIYLNSCLVRKCHPRYKHGRSFRPTAVCHDCAGSGHVCAELRPRLCPDYEHVMRCHSLNYSVHGLSDI